VAQDSLAEQIAALEAEAAAFDGTQKPSTYERRLGEYQRLRERALLYRDALGLGVERAEEVLEQLEQKVIAMLDLRHQTVVHRDGSVDKIGVEPGSPTGATALRFAGSTFTQAISPDPTLLVFVSDDEFARSSAQALEAMGLAGKWQQAGACRVSIQNSGPPGAAVSIRLRLPVGHPLTAASKSLAAIGIELL
jgi:hypothetical protein